MPNLPKLTDLTDVAGKRVLVRTSLNVPIKDGVVTNQFRIARALPTINHLRNQGARIILIAHIGRDPEDSLQPVHEELSVCAPSTFFADHSGELLLKHIEHMSPGDMVMLENVRKDARETANDTEFAKELASLADIFVNDAFAASHRAHASIVGIPQFLPTYFGLNFIHEYEELHRAMQPQSPSLFMLGGAKFDTKMPLVEEYIEKYDHVLVGGALANDIYKARGYEIGNSMVSEVDLRNSPLLENERLLVPVDVTVEGPNGVRTCLPDMVSKDETILDAGPMTVEALAHHIKAAKTILWNGPLGNYEAGFAESTEAVGRLIAESAGYAVLGGGDTIAAIESIDQQERFGFLSTAGGAMLTFMEEGTLPAIDAVLHNSSGQ